MVHEYAPGNNTLSSVGARIDSNQEFYEVMNSTSGANGGGFTARNLFRDESIQQLNSLPLMKEKSSCYSCDKLDLIVHDLKSVFFYQDIDQMREQLR